MTPERWHQIHDVFSLALNVSSDQRNVFLAEKCVGDQELRDRVERLLDSDHAAQSDNFLRPAPVNLLEGFTHNESQKQTPKTDELSLDFLTPPEHQGDLGTLDRYRIVSILGKGGMGVVLQGYDTKLHRPVAVKVLRPTQSERTDRLRFMREAQAAAGLSHENIVIVHDVVESGEAVPPYIVMEHLDGPTLSELIREELPEPKQVAQICMDIGRGLVAAHDSGLVHRDIKPANVILDTASGRWKITDFGVARLRDRSHGVTETGQAPGTPAYMSPEQIQQPEHVDERTDIYSLGVTLYEALTGSAPFRGTRFMVGHQILHDQPKPPRRLNQSVPTDLETISLKCMEKRPEGRYADAQAVVSELDRHLQGRPILARPVSTAVRVGRLCRQNPIVTGLVGVLTIVLLIASIGGPVLVMRAQRAKYLERSQYLERRQAASLLVTSGAWKEALLRYDECIAARREDRWELELERARVLFALDRRVEFQQAIERLEGGDFGPDSQGTVHLLKALLILRDPGNDDYQQAALLVSQTLDLGGLSSADEQFAQGLRAVSSETARKHFETAIVHEPHHFEAYLGLASVLYFSADFAAALQLGQAMQLRFPESAAGAFVESIVHVRKGDLDLGLSKLEELDERVDKAGVTELMAYLRIAHQRHTLVRADMAFARFDLADTFSGSFRELERMASVSEQLIQLDQKLVREYPEFSMSPLGPFGLRLPNLRVPIVSDEIAATVKDYLNGDVQAAIGRLESASRNNKDALLLYARAHFMVSHAKRNFIPSQENLGRGMRELTSAADVFRLAADAASQSKRIPHSAQIMATSIDAFALHAQKAPRNVTVLRRLSHDITSLLASDLLTLNELETLATFIPGLPWFDSLYARLLLDEWERRTPDELKPVKLRAQVELSAKNYAQAIRAAERVLAKDPSDVKMTQVRDAAISGIRALGTPADGH